MHDPMDRAAADASSREAESRAPQLFIVSNFPRPFRVYVYRRIVQEIENLRLRTFYYRAGGDYLSGVALPRELNAEVLSTADEKAEAPWWGRPRRDWRKGAVICRELDRGNVAAVILDGYATIITFRLIRYCRRRRIPLFIRADSNIRCDGAGSALRRWLKRRVLRWVVRNSAGFMPMGEMGQLYFQKYGARLEQCFWVPSVPDYDVFANVPEREIRRVRDELALPPERKYLLFSGRFIDVKRLDLLLAAFSRIARDRPQWDLLMAGSGPLEESLRRQVPATLSDRVRWLGFLPWEELKAIYHIAQVLVLPSTSEAWGVVVMEAMAAGMVVVASDIVAAAHELVPDGVSGRIVEAGSLDSLTEGLADATDQERFEEYRRGVGPSLADWRQRADPVDGVRKALQSVNAI